MLTHKNDAKFRPVADFMGVELTERRPWKKGTPKEIDRVIKKRSLKGVGRLLIGQLWLSGAHIVVTSSAHASLTPRRCLKRTLPSESAISVDAPLHQLWIPQANLKSQ
ncbi:hypothetical protein CDAR_398451 [Caerostris darwini]|uniref:Sulfotransferase n=1 Tax=Caerostris darwini TaxID=1538125 RepID=A0AAV4VDW4_9ARAC|nr:hypothetical protein CDAR_398451 [Caerostris darwini]